MSFVDHVELHNRDGRTYLGNVFATNSSGQLGPVGDTNWDDDDAHVVCR